MKHIAHAMTQFIGRHLSRKSTAARLFDKIVLVTLIAGVAFAPLQQVVQAQTGTLSLGDRIWFDINANGVLDSGEGGIANLTVRLFKIVTQPGSYQEVPLGTTTTDAGGSYRFTQLEPGTYYVAIDKWQTVGLRISPLTGSADDDIDNNNDGSEVGGPSVPRSFPLQYSYFGGRRRTCDRWG